VICGVLVSRGRIAEITSVAGELWVTAADEFVAVTVTRRRMP